MEWLLGKAVEYSDIATLEEIGQSYEGRPIYVLRVHGNLEGAATRVDKPEFYQQSVIHARKCLRVCACAGLLASPQSRCY
eukprot:SAG11_NODE_2886_length_2867_cov_1.874277_1_plen_80_part_00